MAPTIEQTVAKMKRSYEQLLRMLRDDLNSAGFPRRALAHIDVLVSAASKRPSEQFNDIHHYQASLPDTYTPCSPSPIAPHLLPTIYSPRPCPALIASSLPRSAVPPAGEAMVMTSCASKHILTT